jgi:hypothetical protein
MLLKAMMVKNQKTNILAYAVKSDDGKKTGRSNIQAHLLSK